MSISKHKSHCIVSIRSLLKLNEGFKIPLGSLKANIIQVSQNFIKSHLKFCLISQISVHSLWHVCVYFYIKSLINSSGNSVRFENSSGNWLSDGLNSVRFYLKV